MMNESGVECAWYNPLSIGLTAAHVTKPGVRRNPGSSVLKDRANTKISATQAGTDREAIEK